MCQFEVTARKITYSYLCIKEANYFLLEETSFYLIFKPGRYYWVTFSIPKFISQSYFIKIIHSKICCRIQKCINQHSSSLNFFFFTVCSLYFLVHDFVLEDYDETSSFHQRSKLKICKHFHFSSNFCNTGFVQTHVKKIPI